MGMLAAWTRVAVTGIVRDALWAGAATLVAVTRWEPVAAGAV